MRAEVGSVYLCAAPRSGSTLLDRLLGQHPQAVAVGELNHLPKNLALGSTCSCGAVVAECAFWRPVVDRIGARLGRDLWREPYALDLGFLRAAVSVDRRRQTPAYLARRWLSVARIEAAERLGADLSRSALLADVRRATRNQIALHEVVREVSGARVVVDSTKAFRLSVNHYRLDPGRTRVIVLSRDGRGVMASYMRSGRKREAALAHWRKYYLRALPWLERHVAPEHRLHVQYEQLVGEPKQTLDALHAFLGLDAARAEDAAPRGEHVLNGNPMRHLSLSELRPDERWREELDAADCAYFETHGRDVSRRLGYEATA
jgi:hypothetical protein